MRRPLIGVLVGGLIAGTLDIIYAIVWSGRFGISPQWVLQSVASGLLGKAAFAGGAGTAALGLTSHYLIALAAAGVFYLVSKRMAFLLERAVLSGMLLGVLVYLFMNFVVLKLSAFPIDIKYTPMILARGFASHALLFGVPIALAARYFATRKEAN
jgi:hypothetical protein